MSANLNTIQTWLAAAAFAITIGSAVATANAQGSSDPGWGSGSSSQPSAGSAQPATGTGSSTSGSSNGSSSGTTTSGSNGSSSTPSNGGSTTTTGPSTSTLPSTPATAADATAWSWAPLEGKFGLGFFGYLAGGANVGAFDFRFQLNKDMVFEGLFGLGIRTVSTSGSQTEFDFFIGAGFFYYFVQGDHARLGFGGRMFVGFTSNVNAANVGGSAHFEIEIPLQAEYFFSRNFSMFLQVSVTFHITGASIVFPGPLDPPAGDTGFSLLIGQGALLGGAGFTFWFS